MMINARVMRYHRPLIPQEGMGFSWGGFHPFRINDWKKAAQKIDKKLFNITGLDKIKPLANLNRSVWKDVNKIDRSVSMDFQKGKKWAQAHRKELQIAAAIAAAAVGGAFALGYLGTGGAAAAGTAGATEAVTAGSIVAPTITATAGGVVEAAGITAPTIWGTTAATTAATAGGSSLLGTIGTTLGLAGSAASLLGKLKPQQPQESPGATVIDYGGGASGGGYGGSWNPGGGGGGLGPIFGESTPQVATPEKLPEWLIPAGIGLGLILLLKR